MVDYSNYNDQQLVALIQKGDSLAFAEVYERYWSLLYVVALKMTKDEDASMDVVQDIYTDFWTNPQHLKNLTSLKAYLYTTVRNKVLDAAKHQRVKERYLDSLSAFAQQYSETTDDRIAYDEFVRIMEATVAQLPPQMQRVFRMSREEGLSHAAIAAQLGISEHTVKKTINRALHVLRTKLLHLFILSLLVQPACTSQSTDPTESHLAN
ncbi:MAG: RNA polymerase sigma-70 factor [Parapedobacter sp.]|nr:MAG: RNA polymerase sigma-70 factor [Parapedobacter sp.]